MVQTQHTMTLTSESTRQTRGKDQLAMSNVTWKHWQAIILDILMQGEATAFTDILKLLGSILLIKFGELENTYHRGLTVDH